MINKDFWYSFNELDNLGIDPKDNPILDLILDGFSKWACTNAFNPDTKITEIRMIGFNPNDFRTNLEWRKLIGVHMVKIMQTDKSLGKDGPESAIEFSFEPPRRAKSKKSRKADPIPQRLPEKPEPPPLPEEYHPPAQFKGPAWMMDSLCVKPVDDKHLVADF